MEKPSTATVAHFERALPDDRRARRGTMFGHRCAFVGGHLFLGTFAQTLVARVGAERARQLTRRGLRVFEPVEGRRWREYVQLDPRRVRKTEIEALAREALEWTARLPPKAPTRRAPRAARRTR